MVQVFALLRPFVHGMMKLAGLTQQTLEIEPGTIMNIWVPKNSIISPNNYKPPPPTKPAVVLVHAFALDGAFTWFLQVLALSRNYSVYVPDVLFFGGSITDRADRTTDFQAKFLAKGMKKVLGVDKCTVVGLSYGGMIGFRMAKLYPEMVTALVASGTVVQMTESISREAYRRLGISSWSELLMPETVEGVKEMLVVGTHSLPSLPDFFYRDFLQSMFNNRKERNELLEALVILDEDASDTSYSQRIHMLWGDDDKIFSLELARQMKEKLGERATLEYIKNAGHLSPNERPFVFNDRLNIILQSLHKHDE